MADQDLEVREGPVLKKRFLLFGSFCLFLDFVKYKGRAGPRAPPHDLPLLTFVFHKNRNKNDLQLKYE